MTWYGVGICFALIVLVAALSIRIDRLTDRVQRLEKQLTPSTAPTPAPVKKMT